MLKDSIQNLLGQVREMNARCVSNISVRKERSRRFSMSSVRFLLSRNVNWVSY